MIEWNMFVTVFLAVFSGTILSILVLKGLIG